MSKMTLLGNYVMRFGVVAIERLAGVIVIPLLIANVGVDGYGYYGLTLSVMLIVVNVASVRFPMAVIRFFPRARSTAGAVLSAGLLFWLGLTIAATLSLTLWAEPIARVLLADPERVTLLVLAVTAGLLATLYELISASLRAENRFGSLSIADVAERLLFIVFCVAAFRAGQRSIEAVLAILAITQITRIVAVLKPSLRHIRWQRPDQTLWRQMFSFCLPFLPHLTSIWVIERAAFLFIAQDLGQEATGLFTLAFTFAALLSAVVAPLQTTLYPMLNRAYDDNRINVVRDLFSTGLRLALAVGVIGTISLCVGIGPFLTVLHIDEAHPPVTLLLILAASFTMSAVRQVAINLLHITKNTRALIWISPLGAAASLASCSLLIGRFGLTGAAAAILVGTLIQVGGILLSAEASHRQIPSRAFFFSLCLASASAFAIQLAAVRLGPWPYLAGLLASCIVYLAVLSISGGLTVGEFRAIRARLRGSLG